MSEIWYTEKQTADVGITCKISQTVHTEVSQFQKIDIIETNQFGRMLVLDGMVMTTMKDEFVYHEMISHVAMNTHPNPQKVLVVGGGDGGAIRELIKYPSVEKAVLAEIDGRVVELSKQYFPEISCGLHDPRVDIQVVDGIEHVRNHPDTYDVILVDSTEPIGPAEGLFAKEFYHSIYAALKQDGIMVAQTESPFFNQDLIRRVYRDIDTVFPITRLYLANIPTYPSGLWSFTIGSKIYDPLQVSPEQVRVTDTKYYSKDIHRAVFSLPRFVEELLK